MKKYVPSPEPLGPYFPSLASVFLIFCCWGELRRALSPWQCRVVPVLENVYAPTTKHFQAKACHDILSSLPLMTDIGCERHFNMTRVQKTCSEHGQKALPGANWVVVSEEKPKHTLTQKKPRNPTLRCGWITAQCSYFKIRSETIRGGKCSLEKWGQWENPKVQSQPVVRGWWHPKGCKTFPESCGSSLLERKQWGKRRRNTWKPSENTLSKVKNGKRGNSCSAWEKSIVRLSFSPILTHPFYSCFRRTSRESYFLPSYHLAWIWDLPSTWAHLWEDASYPVPWRSSR